MKIYHDNDASLEPLKGKKIAVIGYGSQGHAHALNLRDSGMDVRVGLRPDSASRAEGREAPGSRVVDAATRPREADIVMMLVPDELGARDLRRARSRPALTKGKYLAFGHGFNIHFKKIVPPADVERLHGRAEGPGPPRAQRVREGARRAVPPRHPAGPERRHRDRSALAYAKAHRRHARAASSRRRSRRRPRPISSASRPCSAAASPSSSAPATRRWSRPATRRRWRTSSACTR